jgi:hypothetical protein
LPPTPLAKSPVPRSTVAGGEIGCAHPAAANANVTHETKQARDMAEHATLGKIETQV